MAATGKVSGRRKIMPSQDQQESIVRGPAASVKLARHGIASSEDFRNLMVGMMTDVIQGNISPDVVNAACNAGRGLLRMVEIEYRATSPGAKKGSIPISRRIGQVSA